MQRLQLELSQASARAAAAAAQTLKATEAKLEVALRRAVENYDTMQGMVEAQVLPLRDIYIKFIYSHVYIYNYIYMCIYTHMCAVLRRAVENYDTMQGVVEAQVLPLRSICVYIYICICMYIYIDR